MTSDSKIARVTRRTLLGAGAAVAATAAAGFGVLCSRAGGALVPGVSRARKVLSDDAVPGRVDVVVIGGGNIGCMTALILAERGVKVALCEKGVIAGEASGRSLGYVDSLFLDPVKQPLINRTNELWAGMNARVGAETGYRRSGVALFCTSRDALGMAEQWVESMRGVAGCDAQILSAAAADAMATGSADRYQGALYVPSDGTAEPQLFAPALADAVRRAGGIVLQGCAVRGIERSAGRISAAVTERGRIACQAVALAGGAWSPVFARSLGLDLPQLMAFASNARLSPAAGPAVATISEKGFVMRRTINGTLDVCRPLAAAPLTPAVFGNLARLWPALKAMGDSVQPVFSLGTFLDFWRIPKRWPLDRPSPFEARRILMPETNTRLLREIIAVLRESFPAFKQSTVIEQWAGDLTTTVDNMPVISAVDGWSGLYLGTGFYYGLTMAPAAGEALADLVMGRQPQFDLAFYRYSRFADGSKLVFRA